MIIISTMTDIIAIITIIIIIIHHQAFHPTSVACSEEQSLPAGLCAPGKLWEDE